MNKQTEEKVQDILLSLVEFDGNMEKGFGTTVNVSKAQEESRDEVFAHSIGAVVREVLKS